ncbi:MAG: hypothetical protein AAGJ93_14180 [Bacteroidota bacterium]
MQTVYQESELEFRFPQHWAIRKYDQQKFYLQVSGLGLKGVDFLIIDPIGEGHLYLMEVKNYKTRQHEHGTFIPQLKAAPELAATLAAKYEHTLRAIRAIALFYQQKWWYRLLKKNYTKSRNYQRDAVFWTAVSSLAKNTEQHTLLLWLEANEVSSDYLKAFNTTLQYELAIGVKTQVASTQSPFPPGIVVK